MPLNDEGNYFVSIYGPYFEKIVANRYYEEFKDKAIIEPNLRFFRKITPSVVDYDAEFDIFIHRKVGSVHIIECKARKVTEFDVNRFHILIEDIGLLASNLKFYTTQEIDENVRRLMNNKNIQSEVIDFIKLNEKYLTNSNIQLKPNELKKNSKLVDKIIKKYVKKKIKHSEMDLYFKYSEAALNEYPGYYLLLNNCWKQPFTMKQDIFFAVKEAMKLSIPKVNEENRKVLEFIFIKTCLLEKWHNPNVERDQLPITRDLIKLLMNSKYNENDIDWKERNEILTNFRRDIEIELGSKIIIDETNRSLKEKTYKTKKYNLFKSKDISTLFVIVGMDRFILRDLSDAILELHEDKLKFDKIRLIHTTDLGSIEATEKLESMLNENFNNLGTNIEIIDYRDSENQEFNPYKLIEYINSCARSDAAILITYIPKEWALYLYAKTEDWGYFFVIDRPEYADPLIPLRIYTFQDK